MSIMDNKLNNDSEIKDSATLFYNTIVIPILLYNWDLGIDNKKIDSLNAFHRKEK